VAGICRAKLRLKWRAFVLDRRTASVVIASIVLAAGGWAEGQAIGKLTPYRVAKNIPCVVDNTLRFFPQVNPTFDVQPKLPPHHKQEPEMGAGDAVGLDGVVRDLRGNSGPLWPAVGPTGWTPADCDLAVGTDDVVVVVNSSVAFFTKAGVNQFQQTLSTFFSGLGAGTYLYDAKVFVDKIHNRFVIVAVELGDATQTSKVLLAVSDDGNPAGTWYKYRLEAKVTINGFAFYTDYLGTGYNKDAYVLTGNLYGFTQSTAGVNFMVIPSAPLLSGGAASVSYLRDGTSFSAQAAEMVDPNIDRVYAIARQGTSAVRLFAVSGLPNSPAITFGNVPVPAFSTPTVNAQSTNNRTLDSFDGRILSCGYRGGHLVASHAVQSGSLIRCRWYDIGTADWPNSGTPSLVQSGEVSDAAAHLHMPAINRNSAGDISMIYTKSSTTIPADIMYAARLASDAPGSMGLPQLLESSTGNNYSLFRWGSYFGCDVDALDETTFWGVAMDIGSDNNWKTSVFSWTATPPPPQIASISLNNATVFNGDSVTGTVTLTQLATGTGIEVALSSSNPAAAAVPASVVVANGNLTAQFNVATFTVSAPAAVVITGSYNSINRTANLTVNPPLLASVTVDSATVTGGFTLGGHVNLDRPAQGGGATVALSSSNPTIAPVPSSVNLANGLSTVAFSINTTNPASLTQVTITASYLGTNKTANFSVTHGPTFVHPNSLTVIRGQVVSGGVSQLGASDDQRLVLRPGIIFSSSLEPLQVVVGGTGPIVVPIQLQLIIEAQGSSSLILQKVEMFIPVFNDWEVISSANLTTSDGLTTYSETDSPERFIDPINGQILARLSYKTTSPVFSYPWQTRLDEIVWRIQDY
jgi:hypothetical protein